MDTTLENSVNTDEQIKLQARIKSLTKSLKKARDKFIATLPVATDLQIIAIEEKLRAYASDAYEGLNKEFRLSDEQIGGLELVLVDIEEELNSDMGKDMIRTSFDKAKRIRSFKIGKLIKKTNEIPVSASWTVAPSQ